MTLSASNYATLRRRQSAAYWVVIRIKAAKLKSDGCSGPARLTQWYVVACYEHDVHYRTGRTVYGHPISREQADDLFALRVRQMAWDGFRWSRASTWKHLGGFAVACWRWLGVRAGGRSSYLPPKGQPA